MADNPFSSTTAIDRAAIAQANPEIISGARWFWWIAGLSVVNTVMIHTGSDTSFVIGLGFTLVADAMFQSVKLIAFGIDLVALGIIFGLGWFAGKGHFWAFVVGAILYAFDALIYVYFQDWMSVGFHGLALFFIIRGAASLRTALRDAATLAEPPPMAPPAG
jgi:hypothetical protein